MNHEKQLPLNKIEICYANNSSKAFSDFSLGFAEIKKSPKNTRPKKLICVTIGWKVNDRGVHFNQLRSSTSYLTYSFPSISTTLQAHILLADLTSTLLGNEPLNTFPSLLRRLSPYVSITSPAKARGLSQELSPASQFQSALDDEFHTSRITLQILYSLKIS